MATQLEDVHPHIVTDNHKRARRAKRPRITCTVCFKPGAIRYISPKTRLATYEHRDEPPIGEYMYRGKRIFRYPRCYGGKMISSLEDLVEHGVGPQRQRQRHNHHKAIPQPRQQQLTVEEPKPKPKISRSSRRGIKIFCPKILEDGRICGLEGTLSVFNDAKQPGIPRVAINHTRGQFDGNPPKHNITRKMQFSEYEYLVEMYDYKTILGVKKGGTIVMICPVCNERGSLQTFKAINGDQQYRIDHSKTLKHYITRKMPEEREKVKRLVTKAMIRLS